MRSIACAQAAVASVRSEFGVGPLAGLEVLLTDAGFLGGPDARVARLDGASQPVLGRHEVASEGAHLVQGACVGLLRDVRLVATASDLPAQLGAGVEALALGHVR